LGAFFKLNRRKMKQLYFLVLLLAPLALFAQLDNSFGSEGRAAVDFGTPSSGGPSIVQPADQKIVTAGLTTSGGVRYWYLARFTTTGNLDETFGNGGVVFLAFNIGALEPPFLAIQSNGNIILAGVALGTNYQNPFLFRVTPLGQIDYSFSSTGYVQLHNLDWVGGLAVQSDDKIVVGGGVDAVNGFAVARLTKDGAYDPSFGTNGVFVGVGNYCRAIAFENDGSIIAAGPSYPNYSEAIHLSTKGILDTHFGTGGYANLTVNTTDEVEIASATVIENNYIVLAGQYYPDVKNGNARFIVMELTPQGQYNTAFAGNGKLGVAFDGYDAYGAGVIETWGGRLVVAGKLVPSKGPARIGLCRVLSDGTIDYAFGPNGTQVTSWWQSSTSASATSIVLEKDAKIVVGADLGGSGIGVARYLNPIIIPRPSVITAENSSPESNNLTTTAVALRIFPNPTAQTLHVQGIDPTQNTILVVTDAGGRVVLTVRPGSVADLLLDIHSLAAGSYFLTVNTPAKRVTLPFVKVR
jgi:uncharacterized delta-60 repeat protein